ncbi:preprotein translocase subunit SecE [Blochmannia endosymbiont of Camponotus sp.]|uniref:preprotein translocase subunit SecE n=1 Tax=Blochmannia endosymbiont of Camponotus sp. TaxID=700220 RepID=UPI00202543AC|nr:preprotein translocase subunit SecE [Blochmannia endosymbiont of Camponotus sp.]URJ23873.1 preprotein translocase subunit SecE [Blochmannia endosymbiont of Camponotus sp.]URJ25931.1 preprotein translocase subunit SecE [Blochmannia endosymbiont of Camponotus sp.]
MYVKNESKKKIHVLEIIKWISILGLIATSIVGNYLCRNYSALARSMVIFIIVTTAIYIASTTKIGKLIIIFGDESRIECRKVVWPTYQDGLNTTLVVTGVTIIMSLLLWGLDTILVHVISFGLRL